jgi:hypothetical protein
MTKAQLLESADSMELTKWFAYFKAKNERDEEARKDIELQHKFGPKVAGG